MKTIDKTDDLQKLVDYVAAEIDGDWSTLRNELKATHGLALTHNKKTGRYTARMMKISGRSRESEHEAVRLWANKARRALLRGA